MLGISVSYEEEVVMFVSVAGCHSEWTCVLFVRGDDGCLMLPEV